jgi:hypothetical protein
MLYIIFCIQFILYMKHCTCIVLIVQRLQSQQILYSIVHDIVMYLFADGCQWVLLSVCWAPAPWLATGITAGPRAS